MSDRLLGKVPAEGPGAPGGAESRGRLIGRRYKLLSPVGRGGMGMVWHAHDVLLDRPVAVKELILPYGLDQAGKQVAHRRMMREARSAARLGHPGIVTVHDVVEEDGRPWIVMELVRAWSLEQAVRRSGPLPVVQAAEIGIRVLDALRHAHAAGILHRDVKPGNVLLTADRVVLTDFGIAAIEGDVSITQTGLLMGSPAYVPPERLSGQPITQAADLWSFGATLYAAVEGRPPYEGPDAIAVLGAVLTHEPVKPQRAGAMLPVIEGLLRKNPAERMNAAQVAGLLERILASHGGGAARSAGPIPTPSDSTPAHLLPPLDPPSGPLPSRIVETPSGPVRVPYDPAVDGPPGGSSSGSDVKSGFDSMSGYDSTSGFDSMGGFDAAGGQGPYDSPGGHDSLGGPSGPHQFDTQGGASGPHRYDAPSHPAGSPGYDALGGPAQSPGYDALGGPAGSPGYDALGGPAGSHGYSSLGGPSGSDRYDSLGGASGPHRYDSLGGAPGSRGYDAPRSSSDPRGHEVPRGSSDPYPTPAPSGSGTSPAPGSGAHQASASGGFPTSGSGGFPISGSGGFPTSESGGFPTPGSGGFPTSESGGFPTPGSGGFPTPGSGGFPTPGSGGFPTPGSGGFPTPGSGGFPTPGSGGFAVSGSGGAPNSGSAGFPHSGSGGFPASAAAASGGAEPPPILPLTDGLRPDSAAQAPWPLSQDEKPRPGASDRRDRPATGRRRSTDGGGWMRGGRPTPRLILTVVATLGVAAATVFFLTSGGSPSEPGVANATPAASEPVKQPMAAVAVPDGFKEHTPEGFTAAVPEAWKLSASGGEAIFTGPKDSGMKIAVEQVSPQEDGGLAELTGEEADGGVDGYIQVQLQQVKYRSWKAADWEYQYTQGNGVPMQALTRYVTLDDRDAFKITFTMPQLQWDDQAQTRRIFLDTFRPTS
ncbi:protein kinase domain-containing protein [Nonomuraea sp. NPDC004354]